jgi:spermidine/putrescine transport system ATP-binding protein
MSGLPLVDTDPSGNAEDSPTANPERIPNDVRLDGVCKQFGNVWALNPTSVSIARGEFFSLLGASGSGKTTTLRVIAGFEQPTAGRVFLRERDVTGSAPYERNVNTVFQDYALFPHMTVGDNVGYGLRVRREKRDVISRRVGKALELVRLSGYEHRRPAQLSGGQRQRVALARALINAPGLLLLDEPLGALDLKLRREMQFELKRIQLDVGITFLYVTHDQEEAMSMSDRVAVMSEGNIMQIGEPAEVYERPINAFVAGFVGTSNVMRGRVVERDASSCLLDVPDLGAVRIPGSATPVHADTLLIAVRPEKIMIRSPSDDRAVGNSVVGRVVTVSYAGAFTRYGVSIGRQELAVVEQNVGSGPSSRTGEEVRLVWSPETTHVLPGSKQDLQKGTSEASASE